MNPNIDSVNSSEKAVLKNTKDFDTNNSDVKKEVIEFCTEASNRTRAILIILIVASVLTFIAIHNSIDGSWMLHRLEKRESELLKSQQLFDGENAIDAWKLTSALKEGKDKLSSHLSSRIKSESLRKQLNKYDIKTPPNYELINLISIEILEICNTDIYQTDLFKDIKLSDEVLDILYSNSLSNANVNVFSNSSLITKPNSNEKIGNSQRLVNNNQSTSLIVNKTYTYPTNPVDRIQLNLLILRDLYPKNSLTKQISNTKNLNEKIQESMLRPYSENKYYVKLPFFGSAFDINDLGLFSGIGLTIILLLLRFSLSREIKNLKYGFKTAKAYGFLKGFYYSLAARQIFTVPHMKDEHRNLWLVQSPKIIILLPVISYSYVLIYDWFSVLKVGLYSFEDVWLILIPELVFVALIFILSLKYYERLRHIDEIWETNWEELEYEKSAVVWLDEELIEEFGTDKLASNGLRDYKNLRKETFKPSED